MFGWRVHIIVPGALISTNSALYCSSCKHHDDDTWNGVNSGPLTRCRRWLDCWQSQLSFPPRLLALIPKKLFNFAFLYALGPAWLLSMWPCHTHVQRRSEVCNIDRNCCQQMSLWFFKLGLDILFPYQLQRYAIDKRCVLFSKRKSVQETAKVTKATHCRSSPLLAACTVKISH